MADAALFEFLHMEMVAELWAHHSDPGPGGQKMSLSVLEGMGFRVGQALGESVCRCPQAAPGDAGLQGGAGRPQVPMQRPVGGRVPKADGQPPHQPPGTGPPQPPLGSSLPPGDLRAAGQQLPPPHPDGLRPAVSGGSTQVPGLHLRPPARHPQHPGHQEPGHRLRGIPAHL
ncbi:trafficking protein particle complex subunit 6A isoform X4 [Lynx rufus]|uniref:trafficking protein particle complex subunit 6A isoform X4 n=1 Tax=Lynx rufus TaxID=61384 RepID=UPI001F126761|nr:trafficking protein particle complex subunit 6A isoform X4 [Lynx rufus]